MTTERKKPVSLTRMSRASVKESLDQIPIGVLIAGTGKKDKLTARQKKFAHALATGEMTQADAYRSAYSNNSKPKTIGDNAHRLAKHPGIQAETIAIQAALEAVKYQNANQIKALVVHQLTQHALNEDNPPAQRIRALELLGKTHEVGLFVERKEVTTINHSSDIKAKLLDQLKTFIRADVSDVEDKGADSLMAELSGNPGAKTPAPRESQADDPHAPRPPDLDAVAVRQVTHSIPHIRSNEIPLTQSNDFPNDSTTQTTSKIYNCDSQVVDFIEEKIHTRNVSSENRGGGGDEIVTDFDDSATGNTPTYESGSHVEGDI